MKCDLHQTPVAPLSTLLFDSSLTGFAASVLRPLALKSGKQCSREGGV